MTFYFPDMWFHGSMGHLFPWDVRFDPGDAAHLALGPDGTLRFRVTTEPAFASIHLVAADGTGHQMEQTGEGGRFDVWEVRLPTEEAPRRYTFALLTRDGRAVYRVPAGIGNAVERIDRWELDLDRVRRIDVPEWSRGAVIYQIFPERFRNGDSELTPVAATPWGSDPGWLSFQGGDLVGITQRVPYLDDLGVDLVYVNPIFRSPSTHRYDAVDYYEVDPALGGNEALADLVAALHERDMRLIVDASFNHCSPLFAGFVDVMEKGTASEYWNWFLVEDHPPRVEVRPHLFEAESFRNADEYLAFLERFQGETAIAVEFRDDDGPVVATTYEAWYGVPSLPRIDLADPSARAYFLDVAQFWVREYDIDGWRMDVARYVDFDFWPDFRRAVKAVKPGAYLIAEIMGDASPWLQGDTFDAVMNYTFRELCLDFCATESIAGPDLVDGLTRMYAAYAPEVAEACQNLLGSHDTARFLHEAGEDPTRLALATVLQLTLPGAPGLYYGDEVGMTGGEEPGSRGAFPWHEEDTWLTDQLALVREMTALRRQHPALRHGAVRFAWHGPDGVAYVRSLGEERVLVVVNRGDDLGPLEVPVRAGSAEILWGAGVVDTGSGRPTVLVPAQSAVVVLVGET